jgi:hypothetical protein
VRVSVCACAGHPDSEANPHPERKAHGPVYQGTMATDMNTVA